MTQQAISKITADAVLQTAIQMEDVGRDFYEAVAAATEAPQVRDLCLRLATDELNHQKAFQQMRSELARRGGTVLLSADDLAGARRSARASVLPAPETVRQMASRGDIHYLFDLAVQMEKDSIRFYRNFAVNFPDLGVLEAIIQKEQEHLRFLAAAAPA